MIKLEANSIELDLPSSVTVALTKRVANIGNFNTRNSSFTNKFSVPLTRRNREALGLLQMNTTDRTVYSDVLGKLTVEGIEVISNVRIKIERVSDVAELVLKVENGNLFDLLKKTKLRSVSLRDYDHRWNQANIVASKANDWEDCYTYPLSQTGNQSTSNQTVQCKGLIPVVFVKFMLEFIAARFGYTMTGDGWDEAILAKIVMPIADTANDLNILADYQVSNGDSRVLWDGSSLSAVTIDGINGCAYETLGTVGRWDSMNENDGLTWGGNPIGGYELMLPGTYTVEVNYTYTIYNQTPTYAAGIMLVRRTNGVANIIYLSQQSAPGTFTGTQVLTVVKSAFNDNLLNEKDYLYLAGFSAFPGNATIDYTVNLAVTKVEAEQTYFNRPLTLSPNLPDWDCGKFFREVANFIGAAFQVDDFTKTIDMFTLKELNGNRPYKKDWSRKLVLNNPPSFTFELDGFGKTTKFSYKEVSNYGYSFTINNDQLPDNAEYVVSEFVPTEQQDALLQNGISAFDVWDDTLSRIKMDKKFRVGLIRTTTGTTYSAPNQSNIAPSGNDNVLYFDDADNFSLDWSELYLDFYDSILERMTPDMKMVDASFLLTLSDIQQLDFSFPVYLDQYGAEYFINEVSEFTTPDEPTRCVLVQI
jgi:hypothetical protein